MRKIEREYENPFDNFHIDCADTFCPAFHECGFTPNTLTTFSLIFGLMSLYFLWHKNMIWFAVCFWISYVFDCADGHYARKYGMVSEFGDLYDHIKDVLVNVGVFAILFYRYSMTIETKVKVGVGMFTLFILMTAHLGCQEKIYSEQKKKESATLNFSQSLCVGNPRETIRFMRVFGCGTFIFMVIFIVIWVNWKSNRV